MGKRFRGLLITFEGGEKLGKSTQIEILANHLQKEGLPVVVSREPGGTAFGVAVRELLLNPKWGLSKAASLFLFFADRAQHYKEVIKPALSQGKIIILDRYIDSTIVYQGHGNGWSIPFIWRLHNAATGMLLPDLTFVFNGTPHAMREQDDTFERLDDAFHQKVKDAYLSIANTMSRYQVIDANQSVDSVAQEIFDRSWSLLIAKAYIK